MFLALGLFNGAQGDLGSFRSDRSVLEGDFHGVSASSY